MKKIFSVIFLVSALVLVSGVVLAATTQNPASTVVKYTAGQQACIKTAQDKRSVAIRAATDTLNAATKGALKTRQDALKVAMDALNTATKNALKVEQGAIIAAQKNNDVKARADEIKAANDAYNNDPIVKQEKVPYMAAVKAANDAYNNDATVKQLKPAYAAAVKVANDQFQIDQKTCLSSPIIGVTNFFQGAFKKIGDGFSNSFSKVIKFFSRKK